MSSSNWWAKQLGTNPPAPRPVSPPEVSGTHQPQMPAVPLPQSYAPTPNYPQVPQQQLAPVCPSCRSGNYGGPAGYKPRCYDCGYPIEQSGSGLGKGITGGPQASGPATPAKQVATGGFNGTKPVIGADGGFM